MHGCALPHKYAIGTTLAICVHMKIAVFGSSLVAYGSSAAPYYRGLTRALALRGHQITFFEPHASDHRVHLDHRDPEWSRVVLYEENEQHALNWVDHASRDADLVIKTSGAGVLDDVLNEAVLACKQADRLVAYWDIDPSATMARVQKSRPDPIRQLVSRYDLIVTYGGGANVIDSYKALGARICVPIHNALDPATHFPAFADKRFAGDLGFLAAHRPADEPRIEALFLRAAPLLPNRRFVLGGSGWAHHVLPRNVRYAGQVNARDHNAFNSSVRAILNVTETKSAHESTPPARIFAAAGARACLISDHAAGLTPFLEPGREVLLADSAEELANLVNSLSPRQAREIGSNAYARVHAEHTYAHRAQQLESILGAAVPAAHVAVA